MVSNIFVDVHHLWRRSNSTGRGQTTKHPGIGCGKPEICFVDFSKASPAVRDGKAMLIYVVKTEKSLSVDTMYIL